jgi:hypothetical protein
MEPLIVEILKVELLKPRMTSRLEAAEPASQETSSADTSGMAPLVKVSAKYVISEYEAKANIQRIISPAMLFTISPALSGVTVKSPLSFYKRLLKDMLKDVVIGSGSDDFFFRFLVSQGFFSFTSRYFAAHVAEEKVKEGAFSAAFDAIYPELKAKVEGMTAVPTEIENTIFTISALCTTLPSAHSHHHIDNVVQMIKKTLSNTFDIQDSIVFACDITLACAAFELMHLSTQLTDIVNLLLDQLRGIARSQEHVSSPTGITSASSAIALGLIAQRLCQGESVESQTERNVLLQIVKALNQVCFEQKLNLDWKQYACLMIGLSMTAKPLAKVGESQLLQSIYHSIQTLFKEAVELCSKDEKHSEVSALVSCASLALAPYVTVMFKNDLLSQEQVKEYLDMYWNMIESTESKKLPIYTEFYRNACVGFGTFVFQLLSNGYELPIETLSGWLNHFAQTIQKQTSNSIKMAALFGIAGLFGVPVMSPIPETMTEEDQLEFLADESFVHRTLFATPLRHAQGKQIIQLFDQTMKLLKNIYASAQLDSKVRRTSSSVLGQLCETYRRSEDAPSALEEAVELTSTKRQESVRIPLKLLAEEGLAMHFIRVLSGETSPQDVDIALSTLLQSINLPRINWAQTLTRLMKQYVSNTNIQSYV